MKEMEAEMNKAASGSDMEPPLKVRRKKNQKRNVSQDDSDSDSDSSEGEDSDDVTTYSIHDSDSDSRQVEMLHYNATFFVCGNVVFKYNKIKFRPLFLNS